MKKILTLILALALLLCAAACSGNETEPESTQPTQAKGDVFQVGYSRVLMNPSESIPLSGYGNERERYCQNIIDDICATCIAVTGEDGNTILMLTMDLAVGYSGVTVPARTLVAERTGIPYENIYMVGTHTHSGPAIGLSSHLPMEKYMAQCVDWLIQACEEALADRAPAYMYTSSVETEGMNFVRHYTVEDNATGEISVIGDNFGTPIGKTYLGHATEADPTMFLVKFQREGRKDIVLANWRAHPHFTGGSAAYNLSSDFIGSFRTAMETLYDCDFAYFQGAAGNINENSRIPEEEACVEYRSYGSKLAEYAISGLENMTPVVGAQVKNEQITFTAKINHTFDDLFFRAKEIAAVWQATFDSAQCNAMGNPVGIRSPYHAEAIVSNYNRAETEEITLNAVSIGDNLSFVTFPGEYFDTNAVYVEENSPFATTMFFGYCNEHYGYMPSKIAYEYTSYETDITRFAEGTAEEVQQAFVDKLQARWAELYPQLALVPAFIDRQALYLDKAKDRNFQKWSILEAPDWILVPALGSYEMELAYLKDFYTRRLEWLDVELNKL